MTQNNTPKRKAPARAKAAASIPAVAKAAPVETAPVEKTAPVQTVAPVTKAAPVVKSAPVANPAAAVAEMFTMKPIELPEISEGLRSLTESSLVQAKDAYGKMKLAAEDAIDAAEDSIEASRQGLASIHEQAIDNAKANSDAAYKFFKDMLGVKSLSQAVELQTGFARDRFDAFNAQAKTMQTLSAKMAEDSARPVKDVASKAFGALQAS